MWALNLIQVNRSCEMYKEFLNLTGAERTRIDILEDFQRVYICDAQVALSKSKTQLAEYLSHPVNSEQWLDNVITLDAIIRHLETDLKGDFK